MALGYLFSSSAARSGSPVVVVVAAISCTMVLKLRSGFPRQLSVIKENRRCSILFHLLVPGGRWQTVMGIRNSFASLCSSIFHRRRRWPLLPPPSAGDIKPAGFGEGPLSHAQPPAVNPGAAATG